MEGKIRKSQAEMEATETPAKSAHRLVRRALKAALATLDRETGHPYASLVTVATKPDGTPILLISKLALHTQNLAADPRASLLFDGTGGTGDPLAGGRVTVIGRIEPDPGPATRARFLARQEAARGYADFPDFSFYALRPERAHYIGGFGRIVDLTPADILADLTGAEALIAAEADIVAHMNADHAGALEAYATELLGAPGGDWRMTGIDPEGCDIVCGEDSRRVLFDVRVTSPGEARQELVRLAQLARERGNPP